MVLLFLALLTLNSCGDSPDPESDETLMGNSSEWLVPVQDIIGNFNPFPLAENPFLIRVNTCKGLLKVQVLQSFHSLAETTYRLSQNKSFRLEAQILWTHDDRKNWLAGMFEWNLSNKVGYLLPTPIITAMRSRKFIITILGVVLQKTVPGLP